MSELIQLGSVKGHLARPAGDGKFPALIVIQEWWGLDAQTKSIADRFAAEGYLAFAPDLYHGELAQLGDGDTAMKLVQKYGPNAYLDLQSIFDALKLRPDCSGKIGSVGFCFGGRMSLTLGLSRPLDAICTFYGGGMQTIFDQLREKLKAPYSACSATRMFPSRPAQSRSSTNCWMTSALTTKSSPTQIQVTPSSATVIQKFISPKHQRMRGNA